MPNWNNAGGGLLTSFEKAAITAQLRATITDTDAAVSVTIATPTGEPVHNFGAGSSTTAEGSVTVTGLLQPLTLQEVEASGGVYQADDVSLRVMADDLTTTPTTDSTFTDGDGNSYGVVNAQRDPLGVHWVLTGRRVP